MVKKYRPFFILRFLGWAIALFHLAFAGTILYFFNPLFLQQPLWLIPFCGYVFLIFYSFIHGVRIRLELSDEGILYDSGDYIISTSWNNVERIGKRVPGINVPVEGLVLRTPSANKRSLIAGIFWSPAMGYYEVDYSRSIPLQGIWSWNWRKSKLAEDLKKYLPHLF
jgi:hypothetical protein